MLLQSISLSASLYFQFVQVYSCLQPFMVCMSPSVTSDVIDKLAGDYDAAVLNWTKELSKHIQVTDQL